MSKHGNGPSYTVSMPRITKNQLLALHQSAMHKGIGHEFIAAVRQIVERLRKDPMIFGEPSYRLKALHLYVRQAAVAPVVVHYGVHEHKPLVFIRSFKLLSRG